LIPSKFKDISLLDNRSFIGGEWVQASSSATFTLYGESALYLSKCPRFTIPNCFLDPEDNRQIGEIADLGQEDVKKAIQTAHDAFKTYRNMPPRERRWLIRKWADLIKANADDLAAICTLELGKPYKESHVTVKYGTDFLDWFEGEIERTYGETIPAARGNNRIITIRQPQGVVTAITPWNSPIAMVTRKVGAAIAAGNTVVCKPAPETPLCAIALAKLFERAGFPPGVLNIVTSSAANAASIGEEMCENRLVKHLSFTGSTQVGKLLNAACAKSIKKTSMELGGNAPFIVFEDANLEDAVDGKAIRGR
jgi:succinate-semialdehyde dehydrogenase/glutarate-semialdehyde dehydrogenase